jgi:predicted RND superfamily exporter protein
MTMDELAARMDRWLAGYTEWVIRWRWPVMVASVLLAFVAAAGLPRLDFKNDYKVWFSEDNPQLQAFEALQGTYTKIDNVLFVVTPKDGGKAFRPEVLSAVEELTAKAWKVPFSMRVDSVTNFQHTSATADEMVVADLVAGAAALDQATLDAKERIALAEPLIVKRMLAADGKVTAVNVTFQLPMVDQTEIPAAVNAARALRDEIVAAHPAVEVRLTGTVMLNNAFAEASIHDMGTLVPIMYLVILAVMVFMLRSWRATLATTGIILMSILAAMGTAGWLGMHITPPLASAPTVIMTLAVADAVHLFMGFFAARRDGQDQLGSLRTTMRLNFQPVFLTSISTIIGFLTMNSSDAPPFRDFGNVIAIGVGFAWLFSVTFIPAFVATFPMRIPVKTKGMNLGMDALGHWVATHARAVLLVSGLLAVSTVAMIPLNELNDEFVQYFSENIEFRRDTDYTTQNLTGIYQVMYSLPSPAGSGGVADPAYLAAVEQFAGWLRADGDVVHVAAFTDVMKRLNRNMNGDDPAFHRVPEDRELAAQYLLLYEMSLPYGLDLNNQVNVDKSATMVAVTLRDMSSNELRAFTAKAEGWLAANHPELHTYGVSPAVMFSHVSERNIKSMLKGTTIGLIAISFVLILALRDLRVGLISLVPNLLPAMIAFGMWGVLVGQVNLAVSIVTGMTFGIVVDDTIHFLSKYLRARREQGLDAPAAVEYVFHHVGAALVTTTVILAAGFLVLTFSDFAVNASMAWLTVATIIFALAADLFLLPGLLETLDAKDKRSASAAAPARATA